MKWSRVKTVLIAMMALVNLLLLGVYLSREFNSASISNDAALNITVILSRDNITIDPAIIPDAGFKFPALQNARDENLELDCVRFILPDAEPVAKRGSIFTYTSKAGEATFRSSGNFEFILKDYVSGVDQQTAVTRSRAIIQGMGMDAESSTGLVSSTSSGFIVKFTQSINGYPVFNCDVILNYGTHKLTRISGRWVLGKSLPVAGQFSRSPASTLLTVARELRAANIDCGTIYSITPGYTAERRAPNNIRLVPSFEIQTDAGPFIFNAVTAKLMVTSN